MPGRSEFSKHWLRDWHAWAIYDFACNDVAWGCSWSFRISAKFRPALKRTPARKNHEFCSHMIRMFWFLAVPAKIQPKPFADVTTVSDVIVVVFAKNFSTVGWFVYRWASCFIRAISPQMRSLEVRKGQVQS